MRGCLARGRREAALSAPNEPSSDDDDLERLEAARASIRRALNELTFDGTVDAPVQRVWDLIDAAVLEALKPTTATEAAAILGDAAPRRPRLKETIRALEEALGERPFFLVYELASGNKAVSHLRLHEPKHQPIYVSIGLVGTAARLLDQEVKLRDPGPAAEPPNG